ncbi:hypothetical protein BB559_002647 [Furculomyces boomerangus]|uniref:Uncharacterized protein n=1 Tax=Furculomyces boomerangus TaxID=61424 RepID=A0A2T9YTP1_9FUNG|nr:hypothetical protein BB559_002647 [Furculomyces boomerangus]
MNLLSNQHHLHYKAAFIGGYSNALDIAFNGTLAANLEKYLKDPKFQKIAEFGYLNFQYCESNGVTNGFLGLDPRYIDTSPDGFFSSESSIMDFLGQDKMITIDMREEKSLFSFGNAIDANETIHWIISVGNNTFEFKIKDILVDNELINVEDNGTTAVFNPRYRDIYIEKSIADKIDNVKFQWSPGCYYDFEDIIFNTGDVSIDLKPQSFLKPNGLPCDSYIKPLEDKPKKDAWVFG